MLDEGAEEGVAVHDGGQNGVLGSGESPRVSVDKRGGVGGGEGARGVPAAGGGALDLTAVGAGDGGDPGVSVQEGGVGDGDGHSLRDGGGDLLDHGLRHGNSLLDDLDWGRGAGGGGAGGRGAAGGTDTDEAAKAAEAVTSTETAEAITATKTTETEDGGADETTEAVTTVATLKHSIQSSLVTPPMEWGSAIEERSLRQKYLFSCILITTVFTIPFSNEKTKRT